MNAVTYTVHVTHSDDGEVDVLVHDVGYSEEDRRSIAFALRRAADLVEQGEPVDTKRFN